MKVEASFFRVSLCVLFILLALHFGGVAMPGLLLCIMCAVAAFGALAG